jgi:hypothetical protein
MIVPSAPPVQAFTYWSLPYWGLAISAIGFIAYVTLFSIG